MLLVGGVVETEGGGTAVGGMVATSGVGTSADWPNAGTPAHVTQKGIKSRLRVAILKRLFISNVYT